MNQFRILVFILYATFVHPSFSQEKGTNDSFLSGDSLYHTVKKYVDLGEHRTGTETDFATTAWLNDELLKSGYTTHFLSFPVHQFFPEQVAVSGSEFSIKAFPLWYVNPGIALTVNAPVVNANVQDKELLRGKIVLLDIPASVGATSQILSDTIEVLSKRYGARGVVALSRSKVGGIVALNTRKNQQPWSIPVVLVAAKDAAPLIHSISEAKEISIQISGKFKEINARNVYGTIGDGKKIIVISTPVSGWFTCGGERGPGLAIWLALAKWAAQHHGKYSFVFTANSGHELNSEGAQQFLERQAPSVEKTALWIHLGAGAATLNYKYNNGTIKATSTVDSARIFFYNSATESQFHRAFDKTPGVKLLSDKTPGGELIHVAEKGYKKFVGVSYSHPYFHVPGDDATSTSPEILEQTFRAFKALLELEIGKSDQSE